MRSDLFARVHIPNKVTTVRTKRRLSQKGSHKFVSIHLVNPSSHRSPAIQGLLFLLKFMPVLLAFSTTMFPTAVFSIETWLSN